MSEVKREDMAYRITLFGILIIINILFLFLKLRFDKFIYRI